MISNTRTVTLRGTYPYHCIEQRIDFLNPSLGFSFNLHGTTKKSNSSCLFVLSQTDSLGSSANHYLSQGRVNTESRSANTCTCPKHLNLSRFCASFQDWTIESSITQLTFEALRKILTMTIVKRMWLWYSLIMLMTVSDGHVEEISASGRQGHEYEFSEHGSLP